MKRTALLVTALLLAAHVDTGIATVVGTDAPVQAVEGARDTIRYVEIVDGTVFGGWSTWREGADTLGYASNRYYAFPRTEQLVLDSAGVPVFLNTTGRISDGVPWFEHFERNDGTARWYTPRERGEVADHDRAFYASAFPAHDLGVLARALLKRPSRTLPLLPEGEARLEALGARTVQAAGRARTVHLYAVHGPDLLPGFVWLDEDGATFADEWSVREGWEAASDVLRSAMNEAVADQRRQLARAVASPERTRPLVIHGARLFDSEAGEVREGITIVVEGDRIAAVAPDGAVEIPADAELIDARRQMVLPGLWDVHAHLNLPGEDDQVDTRGAAPLHIAGGVTTVRDVGSHIPSLVALRVAIDAGEAVGPRILGAGFLYDADQTDAVGYPIGTPDEARAAVDRYAALGFRQVKLHVHGSELARAAIGRAKEQGLGVTGHLPRDMTTEEAVEAGYDVLMHLWWILWATPRTHAEALDRWPSFSEIWHQEFAELTPDSEPVQRLVALLAERGGAVDPTIGYFLSDGSPPQFIADVVERFPTPVARRFRHKALQSWYFPRSPLARPAREKAVRNMMGLLPVLHQAGVPVLPGTDTYPGFGLHYEMEVYAEAGIPAADVLTLATLGAARVMGMDDELGSITPGKLADLILVDGDPTQDMRDIRRVVTVVKDGRVYDPAAIYRALGIEPCCDE